MSYFINLFRRKKSADIKVVKSDDIDDKIKSMSAEEYNAYLYNKEENNFINAKNKVEKIIDQAYQNYIDYCKRKSVHINEYFYLEENTYGITAKDIDCFLGRGDWKKGVAIKNYRVKYHSYGKYGFHYYTLPNSDLIITIEKEY